MSSSATYLGSTAVLRRYCKESAKNRLPDCLFMRVCESVSNCSEDRVCVREMPKTWCISCGKLDKTVRSSARKCANGQDCGGGMSLLQDSDCCCSIPVLVGRARARANERKVVGVELKFFNELEICLHSIKT